MKNSMPHLTDGVPHIVKRERVVLFYSAQLEHDYVPCACDIQAWERMTVRQLQCFEQLTCILPLKVIP